MEELKVAPGETKLAQYKQKKMVKSGFGCSIPGGAGNFYFLYPVQAGSRIHTASYPMCTGGGSFPGGEVTGS